MLYQNKYLRKAHIEIDYIFFNVFPDNGLLVRTEQVSLCHEMFDSLLRGKIDLCDAGVGIGKTYAYLVACIILRKYSMRTGTFLTGDLRPVVISTSSITLQEALIKEYIPFLSKILYRYGIIHELIGVSVRKGKEHFVCDLRLEKRLEAIQCKKKNKDQKHALMELLNSYDMDEIHGISGFDRRLVCVPRFCSKECPDKGECRYQKYIKQAKDKDIYFQICNHNYLLADVMHRDKDYRPLLPDYRALIIDEAHKFQEAAEQMYGRTLGYENIKEFCSFVSGEFPGINMKVFKSIFLNMFQVIAEVHRTEHGISLDFHMNTECKKAIKDGRDVLRDIRKRIGGYSLKWIINQLEEMEDILGNFYRQDRKYIFHLTQDKTRLPVLCMADKNIPYRLSKMLWDKNIPTILTSGTLRAGKGFERTRQAIGLEDVKRVREFVAESPFEYKRNCLLYLPKTLEQVPYGSREEADMLAEHIRKLICSTYGHTLVLFTSYSLMGNVYRMLRDKVPFPMVGIWRHSQEEITRFKKMKNAVLFAAGSCWEGVDFPGDMVSSLIIVKLPFSVPNPINEAEKEKYDSLSDYIQAVIVPDMQKKLRQGFGRAIRTEKDTCVVSILDHRAVYGGRYYHDVLRALPACQMTDQIEAVERFIRNRKGEEYYM